MIDGLPIVGLTAPALLLLAVLMLFRGTLVTRREANKMADELTYLREVLAEKDRTIGDFKEAIVASTAMIAAVLEVAQERK